MDLSNADGDRLDIGGGERRFAAQGGGGLDGVVGEVTGGMILEEGIGDPRAGAGSEAGGDIGAGRLGGGETLGGAEDVAGVLVGDRCAADLERRVQFVRLDQR